MSLFYKSINVNAHQGNIWLNVDFNCVFIEAVAIFLKSQMVNTNIFN